MATLTNTKIKDTYDGLLKTTDNEALDATGVTLIEDGLGNASAISIGRANNGVTITGALGIGTSNPSTAFSIDAVKPIRAENFTLRSNSTAPAQAAFIYRPATGVLGFGTANTERMRIDSSGRVGIGATTVDDKLHILGDSVKIQQQGQAGVTFKFNHGNNASINSDVNYSNIKSLVTSGTSGFESGALTFETRNSGTTSERMRIDSSGRVGIGLTPSMRFQVKSSGNTTEDVASFGNANISDGLVVTTNGNLDWGLNARNSRNLTFSTNQSERMRIDSSGRLGIGTSSPASILEISKNDQTNGATLSITNSFSGSGWASGDTIGTINFRIDDASTSEPVRGQIKLFDDASPGSTYPANNAMSFSTANTNTLTERMRIASGGQLFLFSQTSGAGNATLKYTTGTGAVTYDTSSRLVKEDIETIPYGLNTVLSLSPKKYRRIDSDDKIEVGFIADEVQQVVPELVGLMEKKIFTKNELDTEIIAGSVEYDKMTAILVKAIQEQQEIINDLKARIETLEAK